MGLNWTVTRPQSASRLRLDQVWEEWAGGGSGTSWNAQAASAPPPGVAVSARAAANRAATKRFIAGSGGELAGEAGEASLVAARGLALDDPLGEGAVEHRRRPLVRRLGGRPGRRLTDRLDRRAHPGAQRDVALARL